MAGNLLGSMERALEEILARTGIGQKISDELEAERAARFQELATRKGVALAAFIKNRDRAKQRLDTAEAKHKVAQAAAEKVLQEVIAAHGELSDVHYNLKLEIDEVDPAMIACCDPRIGPLRREIAALLEQCASLYRSWPDPKSNLMGLGGVRVSTNRSEVDARVRQLIALGDEVEQLRTRHDVADMGKEIERLRRAIPPVEEVEGKS